MLPPKIAHYDILQKLGEGGMGVVYKARDLKLDRIVALKVISQNLAANKAGSSPFLQEAQAASALNHPNVCGIHAVGEEDGWNFIDMEYVEGRTLREVIAAGPVAFPDAESFALQIGEALAEAHAKGVLHRDVKSDNIMVTAKGQIKVMDFGLARLKSSTSFDRIRVTAGTLAYMAPELIQGFDPDERADLWGFGVVLYEMLAGVLPFRGDHEAAMMYEILNVDPRAMQAVRSDVPGYLQALIAQLLQKDPARRLASAAELIGRLQKPSAASLPGNKSIAVLYFENMSPEKESDYFCAGMTEDIITDLSRIRDLKVVSRNDVFPLRNKTVNTCDVGAMLRVNYVLDGSVRKAGNKMRITANLTDVRTGFHVWADRFDRLIDDVFEVQAEVSQRIVEALKVSVSASERKSLAQKPTDDLRAYDFYLRGRELMYRRGKKNNDLAMQMFDNALMIDPNFTSAYADLAEAYSYAYAWYDGDPRWLEKIIAMSEKVLRIDPDAEQVQFGIGMVYFHQKRFAEAKLSLEKVILKNPDHYDSYRWLGAIADVTGESDAALAYYGKCTELKPYSEEPWMHLEMTCRRKGDHQGSDEAMRRMLEAGERKLAVNPEDAITLSRLAGSYVRAGERAKAEDALRRVMAIAPTDGLAQYNCACMYANLGETKSAVACLRNALRSGFRVIDWLKSDPDLDSLHDDPEYKELLAGAG